jgi:iron complex transport system substrate-binding protein
VPDEGAIVSLLPAATEILAAVGAWARVAAVTHECDVPAQVQALPRVTRSRVDGEQASAAIDAAVRAASTAGESLFVLDEPAIRALAPTLIVTQGLCEVCAVSEGAVHRLAASMSPAPRVETLGARTLDEVLVSIQALAEAVDRADEGAELVRGLQARMRRVHETLKRASAPRPRVAVLEWTDPPFAAGHWVPDMVRRAGGVDVLARPGEHSRVVEPAAVREAKPDLLLFAPCGYSLGRALLEARETLAREEWSWARSLQLAAMDGNGLTSRPGPRLVDGIEVMARLFNPSCFSPLAPGRGAPLVPDGTPAGNGIA